MKQAPDRGFPQAQSAHDNFWDFISLMPEATHMVMWTMSDRAIPRSFRFMEGFGVHTFRFVNAAGRSTFVKFHWKPKLGLQSVVWNEAVKINGADPDFHRRDLWDAINSGDYPEWELGVQLFDDDFADRFDFDVLDATKLIPEELVPVRRVGRLVLDRTVDNFFAETEQVAFCTQNVVPGIDFTNDPLLQGRNFSYLDTQLKRLGEPELRPPPGQRAEVPLRPLPAGRAHGDAQPGRDGSTTSRTPGRPTPRDPARIPTAATGASPSPSPARSSGSARSGSPTTTARPVSSSSARHRSSRQHIIDAFVFELSKCEQPGIRSRMVANLRNVDEDFARRIADGLRLDPLPGPVGTGATRRSPTCRRRPRLSIVANGPQTFAGRKIGVLVTDGVDAALLNALRKAAAAEGALVELVAPQIGGVVTSDGELIPAHQKIDGGPSVLYDAVAILASADGAACLSAEPGRQGLRHRRPPPLQAHRLPPRRRRPLLEAAGVLADIDDGYVALDGRAAPAAFLERCRALRHWDRTKDAASERDEP